MLPVYDLTLTCMSPYQILHVPGEVHGPEGMHHPAAGCQQGHPQ